MRKIQLLALASLFSIQLAYGQSFTITNPYLGWSIQDYLMEGGADISNVSASDKYLMVQKTLNNLTFGHHSYFCLVQCYDTATVLANDTLFFPAQTSTGHGGLPVFKADLETNTIQGISVVSYCFYDAFNVTDSVCIEYIYDTTTGIPVISSGSGTYLSAPVPNPALDYSDIYYQFNPGVEDACLLIYNTLGSIVQKIDLQETNGKVHLNVSGFRPGMYHYALSANGKTGRSGRLIVSGN